MRLHDIVTNPYLWIGVVVIGMLVVIVVALKSHLFGSSSSDCGNDNIVYTCADGSSQCGPVCPALMNYDCVSGKCKCDPKYPACGSGCCEPDAPCQSTGTEPAVCCKNFITDPKTGVKQCCGGNSVPVNNVCLAACGTDSSGKTITCADGESCFIQENLTAGDQAKYADPKYNVRVSGTTGYMCVKDNPCDFTNFAYDNPTVIGTYYPCYHIDKLDTSGDALGFCSADSVSDAIQCRSQYTNRSDCTSHSCKWIDVLDTAIQDAKAGSNVLSTNIRNSAGDTNAQYGAYCGLGGSSYIRAPVLTPNGKSCTPTPAECIARLAGPGVTEIVYDDSGPFCAAIMPCSSSSSGTTTANASTGLVGYKLDCGNDKTCSNLTKIPNPYYHNPLAPTSSQSTASDAPTWNTDFQDCGASAYACPSAVTSGSHGTYGCEPSSVGNNILLNSDSKWVFPDSAPTAFKVDPCTKQSGGTYATSEACIDALCTAKGTCCLPGWTYNSFYHACIQETPQNPSSALSCGGSPACSQTEIPSSCGKAWTAFCAPAQQQDMQCTGVCDTGDVSTDDDAHNPWKSATAIPHKVVAVDDTSDPHTLCMVTATQGGTMPKTYDHTGPGQTQGASLWTFRNSKGLFDNSYDITDWDKVVLNQQSPIPECQPLPPPS